MFDTLISNVTVYDGTGAKPYIADIGIKDELIAAIGDLEKRANVIIDGTNLSIAPGFIDVHTHDDYALVQNPTVDYKLMQGVTTSIVGNCGFSVAPYEAAVNDHIIPKEVGLVKWAGHKGFLNYLDKEPVSLNVGLLVGHNTLRSSVIGNTDSKATSHDIRRMQIYAEEGIEAGVVGISSGLFYVPGCYSKTEELIELLKVFKDTHTVYASHIRSEENELISAVKEAIEIGEKSHMSVEISHFKAAGRKNWGKIREALELIYQAISDGMNINVDQYPYSSGSTSLKGILGKGLFGKGVGLQYNEALIAYSKIYPHYMGLNIEEVAHILRMTPQETIEQLVSVDDEIIAVFLNLIDEKDIRTIMTDPITIFASDGIPAKGNPHPRLYGTFPRILGHYVRDEKVLSLESAIHKMTEKPALKFNLQSRGAIKENYYADLVIFDKNKISAEIHYKDSRIYPKGIIDVFVNGTRVVKNGEHTLSRPGKVLRRED